MISALFHGFFQKSATVPWFLWAAELLDADQFNWEVQPHEAKSPWQINDGNAPAL